MPPQKTQQTGQQVFELPIHVFWLPTFYHKRQARIHWLHTTQDKVDEIREAYDRSGDEQGSNETCFGRVPSRSQRTKAVGNPTKTISIIHAKTLIHIPAYLMQQTG
jgi:hypothetical protein